MLFSFNVSLGIYYDHRIASRFMLVHEALPASPGTRVDTRSLTSILCRSSRTSRQGVGEPFLDSFTSDVRRPRHLYLGPRLCSR